MACSIVGGLLDQWYWVSDVCSDLEKSDAHLVFEWARYFECYHLSVVFQLTESLRVDLRKVVRQSGLSKEKSCTVHLHARNTAVGLSKANSLSLLFITLHHVDSSICNSSDARVPSRLKFIILCILQPVLFFQNIEEHTFQLSLGPLTHITHSDSRRAFVYPPGTYHMA